MDKFIDYIGQNWRNIMITIAVIIALYLVMKWTGIWDDIRNQFRRRPMAMAVGDNEPVDFDDAGNIIPFNPRPFVITLKAAMDGWGTDEQAIFGALEGKTEPQLAAIYNDYQDFTGNDLFVDFQNELSGDDLEQALSYFNNLEIN